MVIKEKDDLFMGITNPMRAEFLKKLKRKLKNKNKKKKGKEADALLTKPLSN